MIIFKNFEAYFPDWEDQGFGIYVNNKNLSLINSNAFKNIPITYRTGINIKAFSVIYSIKSIKSPHYHFIICFIQLVLLLGQKT